MKQLPIPILKACLRVQASLFSLNVLISSFGGRAESKVSKGSIFPQGVLAATAFVGGKAGVGGARARIRCEPELLLCSVVFTTLSGSGLGP